MDMVLPNLLKDGDEVPSNSNKNHNANAKYLTVGRHVLDTKL